MALIGKIRKNFWFVLILLGLALAAFILMDMQGQANTSGASMSMGKVAGQKIDYREFSRAENALYSGNPDVFNRRESLWNFFVEKAIIEDQAEDLGLNVTKAELMDLQFGNRLSPVIQNNFRNSQTGQVDRNVLLQFKQAIENNELSGQQREFWAEQENQIIKSELQSKLGNLVSKAIYSPTFLVEETGAASNSTVDMAYVKIPFDEIDTDVEVTDADITAYIKDNEKKYTSKEETRVVEYAVVDVIPTAADSTQWLESINGLIEGFVSTDDDSTFAFNNGGFYANVYFKNDDLPENLQGKFNDIEIGGTYGPYEDQGAYLVAKLLDRRVVPDSVEAKHILRRATPGVAESFATAEAYIDSLMVEYNRGVRFDTLAVNNSEDQSNSFKGGDLGTFAQGAMVPPFNDAVFLGSKGRVYKVRTRFGVHMVKVEDQIFNDRNDKYKIATIRTPIIPTEETQNRLNDKIADLITENRNIESMKKAASALGYTFQASGPLKINDYIVGNLGSDNSSREIVKWAFMSDTEIGEVSPVVYSYSDKVNYFDNKYVIASLKSIQKPGLYSAESMRSTLENVVSNRKKAESIMSSLGSDLAAVASKYGVEVDTVNAVKLSTSFIPGLGSENEVIAKAFSTDINNVSSVIGNSGVFMIKPLNKTEGSVASIPQMRQLKTNSSRSQAEQKLIRALRNQADIEDSRNTFF